MGLKQQQVGKSFEKEILQYYADKGYWTYKFPTEFGGTICDIMVVKNAATLSKALIERGFNIVSGGTDNHLMLVDLQNLDLTGKEVEKLLDSVHITCNKNTVPNDPASPFVTSGIRLGTPAITTRGMNTADMDQIAQAIAMLVEDVDANKAKAMEIVKTLTDKYPLYEQV